MGWWVPVAGLLFCEGSAASFLKSLNCLDCHISNCGAFKLTWVSKYMDYPIIMSAVQFLVFRDSQGKRTSLEKLGVLSVD